MPAHQENRLVTLSMTDQQAELARAIKQHKRIQNEQRRLHPEGRWAPDSTGLLHWVPTVLEDEKCDPAWVDEHAKRIRDEWMSEHRAIPTRFGRSEGEAYLDRELFEDFAGVHCDQLALDQPKFGSRSAIIRARQREAARRGLIVSPVKGTVTGIIEQQAA